MRAQKHITIAIAGHPGHGKSALAAYLATGRLVEGGREKARTGAAGRAEILEWRPSPEQSISLMDIPGHPRLLKNAIRGLSGADLAILVVAADDGVMPQTLERLNIIHYMRIPGLVIALSKADLVDGETLELAELEIRDALQNAAVADKPVIPVSMATGSGLSVLVSCVLEEMGGIPGKNPDGEFRMWIDEINSIPGFGAVARGVIASGTVKPGDPLWLLPAVRETRARTLEVHHRKVTEAVAGQRVGVSLPKLSFHEIRRGMTLVKEKPESLFVFLNAAITADRPIRNRQRVKLHIGTSVSNALAVLMEPSQLETGQTGLVQFRICKPLFSVVGDPVILCALTGHAILGGGRILETAHEKYRAAKAGRLIPYLTALVEGNWNEAILRHVMNRPHRLVGLSEIADHTGVPAKEVHKRVHALADAGEIIACGHEAVMLAKTYTELTEKVYGAIVSFFKTDPLKKAVSREEIRQSIVPVADEGVLKSILENLCGQNRVIKLKGGYGLAGFTPRLNPSQQKLARLLMDFAVKMGLLSFSAEFFCIKTHQAFKKQDVQKILAYLHDQEMLIRLNDGHYLHADMLMEIMVRVKAAIDEKGSIRMSDSMEILGYGRSNAAAIFEYLDDIRFTIRQGDERRLADNCTMDLMSLSSSEGRYPESRS